MDLSLASLREAVRGRLLFGQGLIDPLLTAFAIGLWGRPQGESSLFGPRGVDTGPIDSIPDPFHP